nr:MAG TPA: hypothetical protein [Bacteriophage sp.]
MYYLLVVVLCYLSCKESSYVLYIFIYVDSLLSLFSRE